ncbi:Pentatricopeptide repeat-containing protein [Forsythia ovata]|uniref:Pentatricopeptide repeat-containing protein n=1 Tax=Forsythia ovata TaxID=205694 RepID=A0ABD1P411_9LAMI
MGWGGGWQEMRDLVSWNTMIAAYSHHRCGRDAIKLFKEMQNMGFKPNDVRARRLKEAYDLIEQLRNKVSAGVWRALLTGCNIHGDKDVGKLAANKLLDMEPENVGT